MFMSKYVFNPAGAGTNMNQLNQLLGLDNQGNQNQDNQNQGLQVVVNGPVNLDLGKNAGQINVLGQQPDAGEE